MVETRYAHRKAANVMPVACVDEEACSPCGACQAVCPTEAITMDPVSMKIVFDNSQCIACEACVTACPPRAMEVKF